MSEQNEFGRTTAEELEKVFETEEQEEKKNENWLKGRAFPKL